MLHLSPCVPALVEKNVGLSGGMSGGGVNAWTEQSWDDNPGADGRPCPHSSSTWGRDDRGHHLGQREAPTSTPDVGAKALIHCTVDGGHRPGMVAAFLKGPERPGISA